MTQEAIVLSEVPPQAEILKDIIEKMSRATYINLERQWSVNLTCNVLTVVSGKDAAQELANTHKEKPALIVGAGPSLDPTILKDIPEGTQVIACDRALKTLLSNGIKPHYVVSVDASPKIIDFYPEDVSDIKLVLSCFVHNNIHDKRKTGEIYWFVPWLDNPYTEEKSLSRWVMNGTGKSLFHAYGNVGGYALHLAGVMGCQPIILHAIDFCYGPIDKVRPEDTPYWDKETKFYKIRNPLGYEVLTDSPMLGYRAIMLDAIEHSQNVKIIVASKYSTLFGLSNIEMRESVNGS